ncbi:MAG: tail fiber protein [Cyclobacteriaceae bacterium]|nr:tail fiber protein [Cyclobacteriaceae bacterium]
MKNFVLTVLFTFWVIVTLAQQNLTLGSALYFNNSGNAPDGLPYARFTENYGIRFNSPDSRWVFSSKPSVLIGYTPLGENWGDDNLFVYGKVGIGTTNALEKLTIMGNVHLPLGNSLGHLQSNDNFTYDSKSVGHYSVGWYNDSWQTGAQSSYYSAYGGMKFFTQGASRMVIHYNGHVGIGTTNPPQQFSLTGGIGFANQNASDKKLYSPTDGLLEWMTHNAAADHAFAVSHQGEKKVYLSSFGNSYLIGGNVGIGTTNPTEKLTVNGTVYSKEVKVDVSAGTGPDYVFEPTYQLPSLTEIENYIKANNHLPEVPSAKEMETNGINLSEMNMLLLKKVEELTLHLIEQKKEINELKRLNEKIEKLLYDVKK